MNEIKAQYDFMVETGELFVFFPDLTGDWKLDQKEFMENFTKNMDFETEGWIDLDDF